MLLRVSRREHIVFSLRIHKYIIVGRLWKHCRERIDSFDSFCGVEIIFVRPKSDNRTCRLVGQRDNHMVVHVRTDHIAHVDRVSANGSLHESLCKIPRFERTEL